jgi:large repetitive protein
VIAVPGTAQTVSFTSTPSGGRAGGSASLGATATSGLPVTFSTTTPAICSVSGSTVSYLRAGDCVIVASQAGSTAYAPAQATQTIRVAAAAGGLAVTGATVGTAPLWALGAMALGGLLVAFVAVYRRRSAA